MTCNMGKMDRIIRLIIGLVAVAWGLKYGNIIADVIGGILLLTALIGWCPLYMPFGINTGCKRKDL
ncbi:MAG TPA: DUF2892 domain-containing protein [Sulfurovum sp.]|uniref:YgaP family membrane protein n=1 Tax=Sulfurovum sp. TaxID=1969726 RepID=UPI002F93F384